MLPSYYSGIAIIRESDSLGKATSNRNVDVNGVESSSDDDGSFDEAQDDKDLMNQQKRDGWVNTISEFIIFNETI